ncbi:Amidophosphoribosyltransferase 2, chloroplastic, partial [Linum perenne]
AAQDQPAITPQPTADRGSGSVSGSGSAFKVYQPTPIHRLPPLPTNHHHQKATAKERNELVVASTINFSNSPSISAATSFISSLTGETNSVQRSMSSSGFQFTQRSHGLPSTSRSLNPPPPPISLSLTRAQPQLPGDLAIGHVRYSTAGSSMLKNVQPFVAGYRFGFDPISMESNNGNRSPWNPTYSDVGCGSGKKREGSEETRFPPPPPPSASAFLGRLAAGVGWRRRKPATSAFLGRLAAGVGWRRGSVGGGGSRRHLRSWVGWRRRKPAAGVGWSRRR